MNKQPNELTNQSNNFLYCCDVANNDGNINGQKLIYNYLYNYCDKEINDSYDNNDDERIKFEDLNINHEQNNQFNIEKNNNRFNTNIFPTLDEKSKKSEKSVFDIGYPFDFNKKIIDDNFSNEDLYRTKTKMKTRFITTLIGKKKSINDEIEGRKFDDDNIIRKIKISYTDFIIDIINIIVFMILNKNFIKSNYIFYYLSHEYKNKASKVDFNLFKTQTIEDVIKNEISSQFKTKEENSNKETCEKIKKDEKLKDIHIILNKNILFFFDNIYHKERKEKYNLNEFGLFDLEIVLPKKVELYEDLLSKNKNENKFNTYKTKMNLCCKKYFIPGNASPHFNTRKKKKRKA